MHRSVLITASLALVLAASACMDGASPSPVASPSQGGEASAGPLSCVSGAYQLTEDARGPKGDLTSIARRAVGEILAGDLVEAGIDEAGFTVVRITRGGEELGTLSYYRDPDGGWLLHQWTICAGLSVD